MRLTVVGLGMVGLPTALLFAEAGCEVLGVEVDERRLDAYRRGAPDGALEPEVATLLRAVIADGRIRFGTAPEAADATIVAVGTPFRDGAPDLGAVRVALRELLPVLRPGSLLVIESTVPPGSTRSLARELGVAASVDIGHAPERVSPGNTLREMRENDRVVGGLTQEGGNATAALYRRICRGRIEVTDSTTAEFVKLIENTYRDVNIALANELLTVASALGIDFWHAAELANQHPRVQIHRPGPGVGGHCIGVAPLFIRAATNAPVDVLMAARARNESMPALVARQMLELCGDRQRPRVAILGTAYKPDVADDRDSPSLAVAAELRRAGAEVVLHDPLLVPADLSEVLGGADCVALLVAHSAYRGLEPATVARAVRARRMLDAAHLLDRESWEAEGFTFAYLAERSAAAERTAR